MRRCRAQYNMLNTIHENSMKICLYSFYEFIFLKKPPTILSGTGFIASYFHVDLHVQPIHLLDGLQTTSAHDYRFSLYSALNNTRKCREPENFAMGFRTKLYLLNPNCQNKRLESQYFTKHGAQPEEGQPRSDTKCEILENV